MILILIPSHYEAKVFISALTGRKKYRAGKADMVEGRAGHTHVIAGIIGMGPPQAARRTQAVLEEARRRHPQAVRGVILCGFAGALKPGLRRGEIFLTAGAEFILPHLPEAERPTLAVLHTAEKVAATAAAKAELHARTGAWLVDMEQAQVAQAVAQAGLPFAGLRIVSDEAHEELPHDLLSRSYDQESGEYTPLKLAGHLTRNPFSVRRLTSFVRPLAPIRTRMSDYLRHTLLKHPGLFGPER